MLWSTAGPMRRLRYTLLTIYTVLKCFIITLFFSLNQTHVNGYVIKKKDLG
jgi:hypothetical protein